jgi:hypothetical protein
LFSTVFLESAAAVDFRWVLNRADAEAFRRIGAETVLADPALWNIRP